MERTIIASDFTYKDLLEKGSSTHVIPALQRPYTWDEKNVEKLWDDLVDNDEGYYVGSVVMISGEGDAARDEVIDGQQRLTTLALFLVALREYVSGNEEFARMEEDIWDMLIKTRIKHENEVRLVFTSENSNVIFQKIVQGVSRDGYVDTETQKRFEANLKKIRERLEEYGHGQNVHLVRSLFKKICNLQFILIRCLDRSITYKLFESINSTGESLASTDMIKNALFYKLERNPRAPEIVESWQEMYQLFEEKSSLLKTYLRHHWISTVDYTSHGKLFDEFQKRYKNPAGAIEYAESLFQSAPLYISLRYAQVDSLNSLTRKRFELAEIKETLQFLGYLGVDQVYSALLSVYNKDPKNFKKHLIKFTSFQFLYKYIPGSPSAIEKIFANYCNQKIDYQTTFENLYAMCNSQKEVFVEKFLDKTRYRESKSGDIQFILQRYLRYIDGVANFDKPTIEHIISKNLQNADVHRFKDKRRAQKLVHSIGNLTILNEKENQMLGEKAYIDKREAYLEHQFTSIRSIVEYPFGEDIEESIARRSRDMAIDIYNYFMRAFEKGSWDIVK